MATTADGGQTWSSEVLTVTSSTATNALYSVSCPDDLHCVAVGLFNPNTQAPPQGPDQPRVIAQEPMVLRTADDGSSWQEANLDFPANELATVSCATVSDCVAASLPYESVGYQPLTVFSSDGGGSWTQGQAIAPGRQISCPTPSICWGSDNYYTKDGGRHWVSNLHPDYFEIQGGSETSSQHAGISCPAVATCVLVGTTTTGPDEPLTIEPPSAYSYTPLVETNLPSGAFPGYWLVAADGGVFSFGGATFHGSTGNLRLNSPIVASAAAPDGGDYWLVAADGGVFSFGDAHFWGSLGGQQLSSPIVGMVANPDGLGYGLFARDGTLYTFGVSGHTTQTQVKTGNHIVSPIVGGSADYEVAADGAVYPRQSSTPVFGSMAGTHLTAPIVGMTETRDGLGYWLVGADGGVFSFGDASFFGSTGAVHLNKAIIGIIQPDGGGYWLVAADGGVFSFGDAHFYGSSGGTRLNRPVVDGM